jgi:flagellar hook-basal body complex protein FliE
MLYEQIIWNTKGVVEVDNEIRVVPRLLQTDGAVERKIMELVNIHQTMIAAEKSSVAFNLMMQIRNKTIDAYEKIMRMPI